MKRLASIISVITALVILGGCGMNVEKIENTSAVSASSVSGAADLSQNGQTNKTEISAEKAEDPTSAVTEVKAQTPSTEKTTVTTTVSQKSESTAAKKDENTPVKTETNTLECTVLIECSTVLDNMSRLKESKKEFVPKNGVILKETRVTFKSGETAFDVLRRVCADNNIQLESSYTPAYGSYYVEGIDQIYQKDCGTKSGWMYSVNKSFPNKGSSSYILKDGDRVEWHYTCDNGADIGA